MSTDLENADSRALTDPFETTLRDGGPQAAFEWLVRVLAAQSPGLRSQNSILLAYTGCPKAIDWLEANVAAPVTSQWGDAAALLGTPWARIDRWLRAGGPRQLMALDTLVAYRAPAPNMSPFAQIAAPVLPDAPTPNELDVALERTLSERDTPRIRRAVETIRAHAPDILGRKDRGVDVEDLPLLFLRPEVFDNAPAILDHHDAMVADIRQSVQDLLKEFPPRD